MKDRRTSWWAVALCAAGGLGCGDDPLAGGEVPRALEGVLGISAPAAPPLLPEPAPVAPGPAFEDVGSAWGIHHTRARVDLEVTTVVDYLTAAVCPIDVDGTGGLDLFFTRREGDGSGSLLYVWTGPGRYREESASRGLVDVGDALGCLAFDADSDRDQDLLVVGMGLVRLFENDGGQFVRRDDAIEMEVLPTGLYTMAAAADFDRDADVDLAVAGHVLFDPEQTRFPPDGCEPVPCEMEAGYYPWIPNALLLREDDGVFRDRAAERSDRIRVGEPTLVAGGSDFDLDGKVDLFFGNDFGRSDQLLSLDDVGRFIDRAERLGVARNYRGSALDTMGWSSEDLDGDEIPDHVVTGFEGDASAVYVSRLDTTFDDESRTTGTSDRANTFRWGVALADFDLDGDPDVAEATGHVYTQEQIEAVGYLGPQQQPTNYYVNDGSGHLVAVTHKDDDPLARPTDGRGISVVDLDDDGRPDLVLGNLFEAPQVLRNGGAGGHWLRIRLEGRAPNTEAIGARVEVRTVAGDLVRHRKAGEGFGGNFDPRLHFGIPRRQKVTIRVVWPDGSIQRVEGVRLDREIVIRQAT